MHIDSYSEKAIVVRGDTTNYKNELMEFGGKWNSKLKDGEGWIFPKTKFDKINNWIMSISSNPQKKPTIIELSNNVSIVNKLEELKLQVINIQKTINNLLLELKANDTHDEYSDEEDIIIKPHKRLL